MVLPVAAFYDTAGPFTLSELALKTETSLSDSAAASCSVTGVSSLAFAQPGMIAPFQNRRYSSALTGSQASALLTSPGLVGFLQDTGNTRPLLLSQNPQVDLIKLINVFYLTSKVTPGRHDRAIVADDAEVPASCRIEAGAVIETGAKLGDSCHIGANAVIGPHVILGDACTIGAQASVYYTIAGMRVVIYPGARIGTAGFGFIPTAKSLVRIPQVGRVIIGNDVEIGANSAVDRSTLGDTVIGDGTAIDNLVQIAHNVSIGRHCAISGHVGIAGSVTIGDGVLIGGCVGISDHVRIGDRARLQGGTLVMNDIAADMTVGGVPAMPVRQWKRLLISVTRNLGINRIIPKTPS